jgi:transposase InsO family protein
MTHANAPLTPTGRLRLARAVVDRGWPLARAADRFQCSPATAKKWADRYRAGLPMTDRSSRPRRSPGRLSRRTERRIVALRFTRRWGPHRIGYHLGIPRATVGRVLARYRMPLLRHLDQNTGLPVRAVRPKRYERDVPGSLVHVDIKKLGRIPDGGGWRTRGRPGATTWAARTARIGFDYVPAAIDDRSRLAYAEILPDEKGATAAAFLTRAAAHFAAAGIPAIEQVMTDNAFAYRHSTAFRDAVTALGARQKFIRPHCPWQNGKAERFNRTLASEWAYRQPFTSNDQRTAALPPWLEFYNTQRQHTALGGRPPTSRLSPT